LIEHADVRSISAQHEQRWLNITGFFLRPGYGFALDDWRIALTWKLFHGGIFQTANEAVRAEWWILWRRIAGGLSPGQQKALALPILASLKPLLAGNGQGVSGTSRNLRPGTQEFAEVVRLLASLEHLDAKSRQQVGDWLAARIGEKGVGAEHGACIWGLGRIGARQLLYGPMNQSLGPDIVAPWIKTILATGGNGADAQFAVMNMVRRTGDRYRDVDESLRLRAVDFLRAASSAEHLVRLVVEGGDLDGEEQKQAMGESLPRGLRLVT
jgi:hypothetical protein